LDGGILYLKEEGHLQPPFHPTQEKEYGNN
jgi:hypothetical protein